MQRVITGGSSVGYSSGAISNKMHGTNMLFHTDRTSQDSDFRDVIDKLGTSFIRFPGGTVTEEYFDITNPNATVQENIVQILHGETNIRTKQVTTLSEYLSYKNELAGDPVIVLPTYRYFDPNTGTARASAEADFRTFIRELMTDEYGDVDRVTIEMGNEFYQKRFNWTLDDFANVQAQIAEWIDEEARALGVRDDLTILAQAGRSYAENVQIASHFAGSDSAHVDGVLTHLYGAHSGGNPLAIGGGIGRRLDDINSAWKQVLGNDYELAVTEWNVGENGEEATIINGIMRSAPLLRIYAEMLEGGVDMAMIWSAQTAGPAGLSGREGRGSELSPTGYFYSMVSESTEGLRLVNQGEQFRMTGHTGETVGYTYTFSGADRSVVYFASGVNQNLDLTADITQFAADGAYVYARILDVVDGQNVTDYWSDAALTFVTDISLSGSLNRDLFEFTLDPYQMVELHIVYKDGVTLRGDTQNDVADRLDGTRHDDELLGNGGNDVLLGGGGQDRIDGGTGRDTLVGGGDTDELTGGGGNDFLYGGSHDDVLFGGSGDDRLRGNDNDDQLFGENGVDVMFGGRGNDDLSGGAHRDYLFGESGNDRLDGGSHDDRLYGGSGRDTFVFQSSGYDYDRIMDFQEGMDRIDLASFGFNDFSQVQALSSQTNFGTKLNFGDGNVLMVLGVDRADLDASDFIL